jgi:hypothetical protein
MDYTTFSAVLTAKKIRIYILRRILLFLLHNEPLLGFIAQYA